jgi:outer membrane protein assembly factor BamB
MPANTDDGERLIKGPAYGGSIEEVEADKGDWPTYRSDNARSGSAKSDVKKDLGMAWEVKLSPPLSTTTTAAGLTFVSEVDKHTLHAFDATTGKEAWHFVAGMCIACVRRTARSSGATRPRPRGSATADGR